MRRRHVSMLLLTALLYGGYWFLQRFQVDGIDKISVKPRPQTTAYSPNDDSYASVPATNSSTLRLATFNIQVFGRTKLEKPEVMQVLAETVRKFDLVNIQEVRSNTDDILPRFIDLINSTGRHYDFVIGPRLGRTNSKEQYAMVFDTQTLEVDRSSIYTVNDKDDLFQRPPLVASFRARGPPPAQAFTFTLIDIHTEPDEAEAEINALAQVYRAVRNDGRGEDDIILMGDLNGDEKKFGLLKQIPNISWVISGVPTNTRGTKTYDNIIFDRTATVEFTGHAGVFDIMRQFNLTLNQALEVSDHFPVWAEFSAYEGGSPGRLAGKTDAVPSR
ncbi:MAG TPA: endonuclease/exonuclease/phosphatase family protein [Pirellulales bacterium]|nr:endonuclease/exonuclease/phosphatase family protein [Pirellulales bacterium]